MFGNGLWQTAILASFLLGATAFPTSADTILDVRADNEPSVDCGDTWKKMGWTNPLPAWQTGAKDKEAIQSAMHFCASRWGVGGRIVGLAAWKAPTKNGKCDGRGPITRLEVRYTTGETEAIGSKDKSCSAGSIGVQEDETFTEIGTQRAGDYPYAAQGKLSFKTSVGGQQRQQRWLKDEYTKEAASYVQLGSGVLIGITGQFDGTAIVNLSFEFPAGVLVSAKRGNYVFDPKDLAKIPILPRTVKGITYANSAPYNDTYTFTGSEAIAHTVTSMNSQSMTLGVKISYKEEVSLPGIVKVEGSQEFSWSGTMTRESTTSDTTTTTVSWSRTGTIPAGKARACTATTGQASGEIPFTSTVVLSFDSGKPWSYTEKGLMSAQNIVSEITKTDCPLIDDISRVDPAKLTYINKGQ